MFADNAPRMSPQETGIASELSMPASACMISMRHACPATGSCSTIPGSAGPMWIQLNPRAHPHLVCARAAVATDRRIDSSGKLSYGARKRKSHLVASVTRLVTGELQHPIRRENDGTARCLVRQSNHKCDRSRRDQGGTWKMTYRPQPPSGPKPMWACRAPCPLMDGSCGVPPSSATAVTPRPIPATRIMIKKKLGDVLRCRSQSASGSICAKPCP